jgi:hypothetical protein
MADLKKPTVTLGGVPLAATSGIVWQLTSGVSPYVTAMTVHKDRWSQLENQLGKPLTLEIVDSRGVETKVEQVYVLHKAPSDSPHRVAFVVADKRWLWAYKIVVRDFNMPRKTGDRTAANTVPIETQSVVDTYDYLSYSLKGEQGEKWTAEDVVKEIMDVIEPDDGYTIEEFPVKESKGRDGQFTVQGLTLRDSGDMALGRALSYIPGADVYVGLDGKAVIFDATDLDATQQHFDSLPANQYAGDKSAWIDRKAIRPEKVIVYYQREIELMVEFEDDYSGQTSAQPVSAHPYCENVIPTVDPTTRVSEYDPIEDRTVTKEVPPGTWLNAKAWLAAMNADRPDIGSFPWTFDTIKRNWLHNDLHSVLGARGLNVSRDVNYANRVGVLKQHFRRTFKINRRYMERIRSLRAMRVGLIDPVSGARAPACVWGQTCIVPGTKGKYMASRGTSDFAKMVLTRNVDHLQESRETGAEIVATPPGPARVSILDEDLGIFSVSWEVPNAGHIDSYLPCNLVDTNGSTQIGMLRDLSGQDDYVVGASMQIETVTRGAFLANKMELVALMTAVPAAPNNKRQFHKVEVSPDEINEVFRKAYRITGGDGPPLEIFVSPGEATARFALQNQSQAFDTVQKLFGLTALGEGEEAGIEGPELPGYVLMNEESQLTGHAKSVATEMMTPFADNLQGSIVTRVPDEGIKLVGNMAGAAIRVATYPSGKVDAVHQFPGQQRTISRMAVMPESTRQIVLGIVPFN